VPESAVQPEVALGILISAGTVFLLWKLRKNRLALFGLIWFLFALAPSLQIVPHHILRADRFVYLPLIGLALSVAVGIRKLFEQQSGRRLYAGPIVILLAALAVGSAFQAPVWKDSINLWTHCIKVNPRTVRALYNRGCTYDELGKNQQAIDDYSKAIEINSLHEKAYNNRGIVYARIGQLDQAIKDFNKSIKLKPGNTEPYFHRGKAFNQKGNFQQAIADFNRVIELERATGEVYYRRGNAYMSIDRPDRALIDYNKAIELDPGNANNHHRRGIFYSMKREYGQAIADLNKAVEFNPDHLGACNDLAWLLATCADPSWRDGPRAVELAEKCGRSTNYQNPQMLDTLAAAYAESGHCDEAVKTAEKALSMAAEANKRKLAEKIEGRLELYQTGQAYHEAP